MFHADPSSPGARAPSPLRVMWRLVAGCLLAAHAVPASATDHAGQAPGHNQRADADPAPNRRVLAPVGAIRPRLRVQPSPTVQTEWALIPINHTPWDRQWAAHRTLAILPLGATAEIAAGLGNADRAALADRVSQWVNARIRYRADTAGDHWAAAAATLASGAGDCEDIAILKLSLLRARGVPADELGLVVGWDRVARTHHALAAVKIDDQWRFLDSTGAAFAASFPPEFQPMFLLTNRQAGLYGRRWAR